MGTEVHTLQEGTLWWVQASGQGASWATASSPASGLFGYVQSFNYTSAQQIVTIADRGIPTHHKLQAKQPIQISVEFLWTGRIPSALSGSGATMPMFHLEHRASAAEIGNGTTGDYHQFYGAALNSNKLTENEQGNRVTFDLVALGMLGPTGSGYIK